MTTYTSQVCKRLFLSFFVFLMCFFCNAALAAPANDADFYYIDPWSGDMFVGPLGEVSFTSWGEVTELGDDFYGATGAAVDPTSGIVYIAENSDSWDEPTTLGTLDMDTLTFSSIGSLGDRFSGITFDNDGNLYGITGDGATTSSSLFSIDKETAQAQFLAGYNSEGDGESLTFNEENGLLYRASGNTMYAIDPSDPANDEELFSMPTRGLSHDLLYIQGDSAFYASRDDVYFVDLSTGEIDLVGELPSSRTKSLFYWPVIINFEPESISPENNSNTAGIDDELVMTFDQSVFFGEGSVQLYQYSDESLLETIDITTDKVTGWGTDMITIDLDTTLENGEKYYVLIDEGAITVSGDSQYLGISDKDSWSFTVRPEGSDFDFDDTFNTKDFIDDENTGAYWNRDGEFFTLSGGGLWSYADRVTAGKELLTGGVSGYCGDGICDSYNEIDDGSTSCEEDCVIGIEWYESADPEAGFCGDGVCSLEENWGYSGECSEDCGLSELNPEMSKPKMALNDNDEQMVVWEQDGVIMFSRWDTGDSAWITMDGAAGAEDISTNAMECDVAGETCGDGFCDWENGENCDTCMDDCWLECSTYHINQVVDGADEEKYTHHFPVNYEEKVFTFIPENGVLELLIDQQNMPFADIDQLTLACTGSEEIIAPDYIRYENDHDKDLREDLEEQDLNVIVASEDNIEAKWSTDCEEVELYMYANEYGEAQPFHYEYAHTLGETTEIEEMWRPSTGHPDGITYLTVTDDSNNLEFYLDITMDNTDDTNKDWLEITIGDETFRVDDSDDTYGTCPFTTTNKVDYKHQVCNVTIPKSQVDTSEETLPFTVEYYGTGGEAVCGDGYCDLWAGEDSESCPEDCAGASSGECTLSQPQIFADNSGEPVVAWVGEITPGAVCGDGFCDWENGEDWMNCPMDCGTTYYFNQKIDDVYEEMYHHHFPVNYEGKNFTFTPEDNVLELLIELKDSPFADIDQLELTCSSEVIEPTYIRYENDHDKDLREDLEEQDLNVIVASEDNIEARWDVPDCEEDVNLYMYANEYGEAQPFHYENMHTLGETTNLKPWWEPSTGHPDGYTYIRITDDDDNIYYHLDITMDNTDDHNKDWLEITIDGKTFRVDDSDDTYGTCPFGTSDKVEYKHQLCDVTIPKSEVEVSESFDFVLEYYGTGGWESPSGVTNIYALRWDDSANEWRGMNGDSMIAEAVFQEDGDALDMGRTVGQTDAFDKYHMIKSSDGDPMIVSDQQVDGEINAGRILYSEWDDDVDEWSGKHESSEITFDFVNSSESDLMAFSPQLARTSSDDPMFVWLEGSEWDPGVQFSYWDGSGYSALGNSGHDGLYEFINYGSGSVPPKIAVDSSDVPTVVHSLFSEEESVDLYQWNGTSWDHDYIWDQQAVGELDVEIASDDTPFISWAGWYYSEEESTLGVYAAKWNGSAFTSMDGGSWFDTVETTDWSSPRYLDMDLTSDDRPMITWSMEEMGSTHFMQWGDAGWTAGDGISTSSDSLSGSVWTYDIDMVINSDDEPSVVWEESGDGDEDIYFSMLPLEIESPKSVISQKINGTITGIVRAVLTATDVLNGESFINYFLSGDGGASWIPVEKDQEITFFGINDLRWRADLYAGSVPELHDVHVGYETELIEEPLCGPAAKNYTDAETAFSGDFCAAGTEDETPSFPDYDQTVTWNCINEGLTQSCSASRGEQPNEPEDEEKECTFDSIRDVTENSVTLRVSVDDEYADEKVGFKVEVEDLYTSDKETIKLTDKPTDNGKATLFIDGLEEDTEYRFKVSYDEEDEGEYIYCPHSKTATTDSTTEELEEEPVYPECGNASKTYTEQQTTFTGTFCAVGTESTTPVFPEPGEKISWTCTIDGNTEQCHAKREKEESPVPPIQGGTDPEPEPIEESEEDPIHIPETPAHVAGLVGATAGVLLAFATSAVPLFATLPMAAKDIFIMPFLGILARRRNEQNWGTVFESTTKQPIPGTKLVLTDEMGKEVETTYSDAHGRFGFLTQNGNFTISIEKSKFEPNFEHTQDPLYGEVYTGDLITIQENKVIATNIALSATNINWSEYAQKKTQAYKGFFSTFKKWAFIALFYAGFVFTAVITFLYPSIINFILLALYTVLFIYDNFVKKKKYGTVEKNDKTPVPFAIVSLHDKDTNAKQGFAVTDVIGRYYLLSENGNFDMHVKGQPVGGQSFEKQGDIHVRDGLVRKDVKV